MHQIKSSFHTCQARAVHGLVMAFVCITSCAIGQKRSIASIEKSLNSTYGIEKLEALVTLADHYSAMGHRKAGRYSRQAVLLGDNLSTVAGGGRDTQATIHLSHALFLLGQDQFKKDKFREAKEQLERSADLASLYSAPLYVEQRAHLLAELSQKEYAGELKDNVVNKTFGNLKIGEKLNSATQDILLNRIIKRAESKEEEKEFDAAIMSYEEAINQMKNTGDRAGIARLQVRVSALMDSLNQTAEAETYLTDAILDLESERLATPNEIVQDDNPISTSGVQPLDEKAKDELRNEKIKLKKLAESYANDSDRKKSDYYMKLYEKVSQQLELDSIQQELDSERRRNEIMQLTQQKERITQSLQASESEHEAEVKRRKYMSIIAGLVLALALMLFYFYAAKRKEHKKLTTAYDDLESAKNKLEAAEHKIRNLLSQQVSGDVATALISADVKEGGERKYVCVMFLDIRGFTPIAEKLTPEELILFQNQTFGYMIDIIQKYHGNVNQLLGDGFMATFGAPMTHGNDCENAYNAAREIIATLAIKNADANQPVRIGIGLHAGSVITGNVGNEKRKQYSITGNPVIIASRIEQLNKKYNSQLIISKDVFDQLSNPDLDLTFQSEFVKGRKEPVEIAVVTR